MQNELTQQVLMKWTIKQLVEYRFNELVAFVFDLELYINTLNTSKVVLNLSIKGQILIILSFQNKTPQIVYKYQVLKPKISVTKIFYNFTNTRNRLVTFQAQGTTNLAELTTRIGTGARITRCLRCKYLSIV